LFVRRTLSDPPPVGEPASLLGHDARVRWIGADVDKEVNVGIRRDGEEAAADGAAMLVARAEARVRELTRRAARAAGGSGRASAGGAVAAASG
jgi:hypothetical protein